MTPDTCQTVRKCGRPYAHRGQHGGWRALDGAWRLDVSQQIDKATMDWIRERADANEDIDANELLDALGRDGS